MKRASIIGVALASLFVSTVALAQSADDKKWVAQCLVDNKDAKVSLEIVTAYCTCMNSQMSESETRTITEWEKANPNTRKMCEAKAGWN